MWLCPKHRAEEAESRTAVGEETAARLRRWYAGEGDRDDEIRAIALVRQARSEQQWIACDCLGDSSLPPLMAPACLSSVRTWYLRRLTGRGRAEHRADCPFRVAQALVPADRQKSADVRRPETWFSAVDPKPTHLAQVPVADHQQAHGAGQSLPRLARLLRLLLERAGFDRLPCAAWEVETGIAEAFERLRGAAAELQIAPRMPLNRLLFTHPRALESGQVLGVLTRAEREWPKGHAPQAFLLLYAKGLDRNRLLTGQGPVEVGCALGAAGTGAGAGDEARIARAPSRLKPGAPWLCLVAVGRPPEGGRIALLKAWAEPVLSARHFFPVATEGERAVLRALQAIGPGLARRGVVVAARRHLFADGDDSSAHRLLEVEVLVGATGEIHVLPVVARDGLAPPDAGIPRSVLDLSNDVAEPERLRKHLWGRILRATEGWEGRAPAWVDAQVPLH